MKKKKKETLIFKIIPPVPVLEKEMATHSSILAWKIPWTEEPDGLQSMGSQRIGLDWSDLAGTHLILRWGTSILVKEARHKRLYVWFIFCCCIPSVSHTQPLTQLIQRLACGLGVWTQLAGSSTKKSVSARLSSSLEPLGKNLHASPFKLPTQCSSLQF